MLVAKINAVKVESVPLNFNFFSPSHGETGGWSSYVRARS